MRIVITTPKDLIKAARKLDGADVEVQDLTGGNNTLKDFYDAYIVLFIDKNDNVQVLKNKTNLDYPRLETIAHAAYGYKTQ